MIVSGGFFGSNIEYSCMSSREVLKMAEKEIISRRDIIRGAGAIGAFAFLGSQTASGKDEKINNTELGVSSDARKKIFNQVLQTSFIDTHEHLLEEKDRLSATFPSFWTQSDDWTIVLANYFNADMLSAGMPKEVHDKFFSPKVDPADKWSLLEPYWPAIKNTGYGQAVCIAIKELYNVDEISSKTIRKVQAGYEKVRRAGFYNHILRDLAKIESCQVNCLSGPFLESQMPTMLMSDLTITGMFDGPDFKTFGEPSGIKVECLSDWHKVIDWWFAKYGKYAVAVKTGNAYARDINYEQVPAEKAEAIFKKKIDGQSLTAEERKMLQDHLFWYAVGKATEFNLPVKVHTGYYSAANLMPLSRIRNNPSSAADLCRLSPQTRFVFMHIGYPYYEEMIALSKQYTNAYMDMCWAWIINPIAAKDFLKKYLVTAPANKILTFGGDYLPVEPVLGHATIARRGIALALAELVEEGWLSFNNAMELIEPIMNQNARRIFAVSEKTEVLKNVKWG
jgi:uncharacterized protein